MKILKRSFLLLVSLVVVFGLISSFALLFPKRYNDSLSLKDVSGDKSVLNGITIKGVLSDDVQQTDFEFSNNSLNKKFSMSTSADAEAHYIYDNPSRTTDIRPKTEIMDDANVKKVTFDKKESNGNVNGEYRYNKGSVSYEIYGTNRSSYRICATIKSDVIYNGNIILPFTIYPDGKETKGSMSQGYNESVYWMGKNGVVQFDDKKYLYTITDSNCSGSGGIYDITDPLNGSIKDSDMPNLAPIDLENGKIQITGMCASKNRLIYLLVKKRTVYMRPYNLQNQQFEEDIEVGPVPKNSTISGNGNSFSPSEESEQLYQPFIETSVFDDKICLTFLSNRGWGHDYNDYSNGLYCSFYVVDIQKKTVENAIVEQPLEGKQVCFKNIVMLYKNNTLYVLKKYAVINSNVSGSQIPQTCLSISAYSNNKSVYEGNILSSVQEDFKYYTYDYKLNSRLYTNNYYFLELN